MKNPTSYLLAWAIVLAGLAAALTALLAYHLLAWTPGRGQHLDDNPAHILVWVAALAWMLAASLGGIGLWRLIEQPETATPTEAVEQ